MTLDTLHIDIETYSSVSIKASGLYKYIESPDFEVLLIAYALNNSIIRIIDLKQGERIPSEFIEMLKNSRIIKAAHNAVFERIAFKKIGYDIPIPQWQCSAVKAAYCGLPLKLSELSKALNLGDKGKMAIGDNLIRYFCIPCKPTNANKLRTRNLPEDNLEKWELFKKYCINDVEAEREAIRLLSAYEMPAFEKENYILDQNINDRGVPLDLVFVKTAIDIEKEFKNEVVKDTQNDTGIDNPNSLSQVKTWLSSALGIEIESLTKETVLQMLETIEDESVIKVLSDRLKLSKTSIKKYDAMLKCACSDDRARGLFQFYGAQRTGRWAGRLIQLQNLPRSKPYDLEFTRNAIKSGDYELISLLYENISEVLSELVRTAIIAPAGKMLLVADFSAIEARVLSWIADETWRLEVFRTHGKIYEASASVMFNVNIESITKTSELRQRGKVAELALGYQGGEGAIEKMDIDKKIPESERQEIVTRWRNANPKIVEFWQKVNKAAIKAVKTRQNIVECGLTFRSDSNYLIIDLPSKRSLYYREPILKKNRFDQIAITYMGMNQTSRKWERQETYGGKLTENIVQATARDLLAYAMKSLDAAGFEIIAHVHDEVISLGNNSVDSEAQLTKMLSIMSQTPFWAESLPLKADGFCSPFYKKN